MISVISSIRENGQRKRNEEKMKNNYHMHLDSNACLCLLAILYSELTCRVVNVNPLIHNHIRESSLFSVFIADHLQNTEETKLLHPSIS